MLNYLWAGMILIGIPWGALHGQIMTVTDGATQASKEAVTLCITMLGVVALRIGVLEIEYHSGLVDQLVRRMGPILTFLFPGLDPDGETRKQMSVNMTISILGLGWTTTPAGLRTMEEPKRAEKERGMGGAAKQEGIASNEICTSLIINISSLQLIPTNMIAYRSQYGSANPTTIVGPALAATFINTVAVVIFCRIMDR